MNHLPMGCRLISLSQPDCPSTSRHFLVSFSGISFTTAIGVLLGSNILTTNESYITDQIKYYTHRTTSFVTIQSMFTKLFQMFIIHIIKSMWCLIISASLTSFAAAIWPMYSPSLKRALGPLFFPENIYSCVNIHKTPYNTNNLRKLQSNFISTQ